MRNKIVGLNLLIFLFFTNQVIAEEFHHYPEVPRISAIVAHERYKTGKTILVNANTEKSWNKYRILGSINMPNDGLADLQKIRERGVIFPPDTEIIVYCQ